MPSLADRNVAIELF